MMRAAQASASAFCSPDTGPVTARATGLNSRQIGAMQAVVAQRAKEQSHAWATSTSPQFVANDGCSLGGRAERRDAVQVETSIFPHAGQRRLAHRGARKIYYFLARASMNVNNDRTAKSAHRSPCNGCATVVESGRGEGLQWLDGSRYSGSGTLTPIT